MEAQSCSVCDYPLPESGRHVVCPECGAGPESRRIASSRRAIARNLTAAYAVLVLPHWCGVLALSHGWVVAHLVLRIPNPHGVQHGEYAILDLLGSATLGLLALSLISFLAIPVVLPLALIAHYRIPSAERGGRWRACMWLLLLSAPVLLEIAMMRPFGGPAWGLVDWIPD